LDELIGIITITETVNVYMKEDINGYLNVSSSYSSTLAVQFLIIIYKHTIKLTFSNGFCPM